MEDEGLVGVSTVGKRGRKPYVLTRDGRAALEEWLLSEPRRPTPRHDALLRTFFLGLLEPEDAARFVEHELRYHRDVLAAYEDDAALYDEPVARGPSEPEWWTGGLTLELGIRIERTMIEWYEWLRERLDSAPPRGARSARPGRR